MSDDQYLLPGKSSSSESSQHRRRRGFVGSGEGRASRYTAGELIGSPDLNLPYNSNTDSLVSFNISANLLIAAKQALEKEFKAQITPQGSGWENTLVVLKQRLSSNLRKLAPIWQKSAAGPGSERSQSGNLKGANTEHRVKQSIYFPTLSKYNKSLTATLPLKKKRRQVYQREYPSIVSVASRTHLTSRYEIPKRVITQRDLNEQQASSDVSEDNSEQVQESLPPPLPCPHVLKQGDALCCQKPEGTEANKKITIKKGWACRKVSLYKDFSPFVSGNGGTAPALLSSPPVVNLRIPGSSPPPVKAPPSHHLIWRFGKPKSASSTANPPAKGSTSSTSFINPGSPPEVKREFPTENPKISAKEYFDWLDEMSPTKQQINQQKSTITQQLAGATNHLTFDDLHNSFKKLPGNSALANAPTKNTQLRSSKSLHGDAGSGFGDQSLRNSNVSVRGQPSANLLRATSNGNANGLRQLQQGKKIGERQKNKTLKPLNVPKLQSSTNKLFELGQELPTPVLPNSSTSSYRLTHDVSFDEESRRKTGSGTIGAYKYPSDDTRNGSSKRRVSYPSYNEHSTRRLEKMPSNPDKHCPPVAFKEAATLSFSRMEEKQNSSPGLMSSTGSRGLSTQSANYPPVPLQASSSSTSTALRNGKESRPNWTHRVGDLYVNGGSFYGPLQPGGRIDIPSLPSTHSSPTSAYAQKLTQSRDKNGVSLIKSRLSSRYGARSDGSPTLNGSSSKDSLYADPYVGAPSSFHQRLTELSILESDTIKYEKSRKTKRKSKQDKDS